MRHPRALPRTYAARSARLLALTLAFEDEGRLDTEWSVICNGLDDRSTGSGLHWIADAVDWP